MANWKHLFFFDKNGKNYNMAYDSTTDKWSGDIFLPQVSIDLFEVGQIFILQKMVNATSNTFSFIKIVISFCHCKELILMLT